MAYQFIKVTIFFKKSLFIYLIFQREGSPYLACNDQNAFFTSENPKNIMHGLVEMSVMC